MRRDHARKIKSAKLLEPKGEKTFEVGEAAFVTDVVGGREVAQHEADAAGPGRPRWRLLAPFTGTWFKVVLCSGSTQASGEEVKSDRERVRLGSGRQFS